MIESRDSAPQHAKHETLKLYHCDKLIGIVTDPELDWPWYGGKIQLTEAAKPFVRIWEFFAIEKNRQFDPPFEIPESLEENWFVEDVSGKRLALDDLPAVHPEEGTVWWQFE